jgi:hypothetical protein
MFDIEEILNSRGKNLCLSGGAKGADLLWGENAILNDQDCIHWSFEGHKKPSNNFIILPENVLTMADQACKRANLTLDRRFPPRNHDVASLLRRNWFQVVKAGSCYAISKLENGKVAGGTAWAVQMFIDKFNGEACRAFVFCQTLEAWHEWNGKAFVEINTPPLPQGRWAGIGSRDLLQSGEQAIINTFKAPQFNLKP